MFEYISLQPPEHVWSQHVMELLDLVLFGNVCKFLKKSFQVAAEITSINNASNDSNAVTYEEFSCAATDLNLSGVKKFSKWKSSSKLF